MSHTIPFMPAICITLNTMLGSGLFLNTTELAQRAGSLGFLAYVAVGILMLPLVLGMSRLVALYPQGGFYTFGARELHPLVGFMSAWTYFVGKLASATLIIHTAALLLQQLIPILQCISPFYIDVILIAIFCISNMLNVRTGSSIQYFFLTAKCIPVLTMIGAAIYWWHPVALFNVPAWSSIPSTIPLVLYAIVGFEAACSLSSKIENAAVNAPRVILIAYAIIIALDSLYQWCAYTLLGNNLLHMRSFLDVFAALAQNIAPVGTVEYIQIALYSTIVISALGAAYGILYSNLWNMYAIAQHGHTYGTSLFTALNKHHIPVACVVLEALICGAYLWASHGMQIPLQQITSSGLVFAYTISALALWIAIKRKAITLPPYVAHCALINCCMLAGVCLLYLLHGGSFALYLFFSLLAGGFCMAWCRYN
jgi:amino acid transporter